MIFNIVIREEFKHYVDYEADTAEEAIEIVKGLYDDGNIVLDIDDLTSVDFKVEGVYD